jgi:hypothetical protein
MTTTLCKAALLLVIVFALPMLFIRAQRYNDSDLHALLNPPEGCAAPCFMGIRPGAMDIWDVLDVLHNHEWVARIGQYDFEQFKNPDGTITIMLNWEWSGAQPDLIDASQSGSVWILDDNVVSIEVATFLRLGDIRLGMGAPERERSFSMQSARANQYTHYIWYPQGSQQMVASQPCPVDELNRVRVVVQWTAKPLELPEGDTERRRCG